LEEDKELFWEELWTIVLKEIKGKSRIFQKPIKGKNRKYIISGEKNCYYTMSVSIKKKEVTVKLDFNNMKKTENNIYAFEKMHEAKKTIEGKFGNNLIWYDIEDQDIKSIQYVEHFNGFETESEKAHLVDFYVKNIVLLEEATREVLKSVNMNLK